MTGQCSKRGRALQKFATTAKHLYPCAVHGWSVKHSDSALLWENIYNSNKDLASCCFIHITGIADIFFQNFPEPVVALSITVASCIQGSCLVLHDRTSATENFRRRDVCKHLVRFLRHWPALQGKNKLVVANSLTLLPRYSLLYFYFFSPCNWLILQPVGASSVAWLLLSLLCRKASLLATQLVCNYLWQKIMVH